MDGDLTCIFKEKEVECELSSSFWFKIVGYGSGLGLRLGLILELVARTIAVIL